MTDAEFARRLSSGEEAGVVVRALDAVECDGVRLEPGARHLIRAALAPRLVELGVVEVEGMQGGGSGQEKAPDADGAVRDAPGAQGGVSPPGAPTGAGSTPAPAPPADGEEPSAGTTDPTVAGASASEGGHDGAGEAASADEAGAGELGLAEGREAPDHASEGRAGADGGSAPAKRPASPRKGRAAG